MVLTLAAAHARGEPLHKVQLDPLMVAAGYANIQIDREIGPTLSAGLMVWHLDDQSWGLRNEESSFGVRIDWFEEGVFQQGWHSNAMVKVDLEEGAYARTRLKLTQTYQLVRSSYFVNLGIGAQFVAESQSLGSNEYYGYQSWMLPSWEFSVGRAF
jgi:hypothetical protein